jgi:hypothetical protein
MEDGRCRRQRAKASPTNTSFPSRTVSRHMSDGHQQTALTQEFPFQVSPFIPTTAESGCNAVALSRQVRQS